MKKDQTLYVVKGKYSIVEGDIGEGTVIWNFVNIMEGAKIGKRCVICDHVTIEKGAIIGNNVKIGPFVYISGNVIIEDGAQIGAGSKLISRKTIIRIKQREKIEPNTVLNY